MMKCVKCDDSLPVDSDYVVCGACVSKFHYNCSVREAKWRNMSAEQKKKWVCVKCKGSSSNLSRVNSASSSLGDVDRGQEEDVSMKTLLLKMNARLDTLDDVKKTVDGMSDSLQFLSSRYDELLEEVRGYRESNKELAKEVDKLKTECARKDDELSTLTRRFNALEQYGRGVNLEVHGLEQEFRDESFDTILKHLATSLQLPYNPADIQAVHRLPASATSQQPPKLLIQFVSKATKERWLRVGKRKRLLSKDVVGVGEQRLYFNENLTPYFGRLFQEARRLAREKKYESVWVMHGTIRVKKSRDAREIIVVTTPEDLKRIV